MEKDMCTHPTCTTYMWPWVRSGYSTSTSDQSREHTQKRQLADQKAKADTKITFDRHSAYDAQNLCRPGNPSALGEHFGDYALFY